MSDENALTIPNIYEAPVPKELEAEWAEVVKSSAPPGVLRALYRAVVLDQAWRAAAKAEGVEFRAPWRLARRFGLAGRRPREQTTRQWARINELAGQEIEDRLLTDAESLTPRDLNFIWGTSADKLGKEWDRERETANYVSALDALAQQLSGGSGEVTLSLRVQRDDDAVDVTPKG